MTTPSTATTPARPPTRRMSANRVSRPTKNSSTTIAQLGDQVVHQVDRFLGRRSVAVERFDEAGVGRADQPRA